MLRSPCFINVEEGNKATEYIARGIAVVLQADILDDVGFSSFCFSLFSFLCCGGIYLSLATDS